MREAAASRHLVREVPCRGRNLPTPSIDSFQDPLMTNTSASLNVARFVGRVVSIVRRCGRFWVRSATTSLASMSTAISGPWHPRRYRPCRQSRSTWPGSWRGSSLPESASGADVLGTAEQSPLLPCRASTRWCATTGTRCSTSSASPDGTQQHIRSLEAGSRSQLSSSYLRRDGPRSGPACCRLPAWPGSALPNLEAIASATGSGKWPGPGGARETQRQARVGPPRERRCRCGSQAPG